MIANYHTHTWRCNHASGAEEIYVQAALEQKLQILGFSDHSPHFFPNGYVSMIRMVPEQLGDYCATVRDLRDRYSDRIQIQLGLELEYYPGLIPALLPVLRDQGVEYLLLGQHFLGNEQNEPYCGRATADESILKRYCHQSMDAMNSGIFTYFAHPDLIRYVGDEDRYRTSMRSLCREARSCGIPLEINLLGLWSGRHYPNRCFWEIAAEEGCQVVLGLDAHSPEELAKPEAEQRAMEIIRHYGLKYLPTVELRTI